jgi:hypothetical protein
MYVLHDGNLAGQLLFMENTPRITATANHAWLSEYSNKMWYRYAVVFHTWFFKNCSFQFFIYCGIQTGT